ncbi:ABC transporter permease [Microbacterium sp. SLBN-146]|uniref:ABC transporter permease n=1 Tax=Microbacterium sp. SLBN-146 TaxID=2768457 RepID=UPI00115058A8|nr:ABC transporter permease [Microbacterium sp. SLBN-146]TQJ30917.1 monosaccharide ABC transporter membrane protein (CUT2 family) [Microbacterium sp. SLBN-146]
MTTTATPAATRGTGRRIAQQAVGNYAIVIFLLVLIAVFSMVAPTLFPTWSNFQAIANNQAVPAILALAVILPLAAGEFDLSVGATLGFTSVLTAWASIGGVPLVPAILLGIGAGAIIGAVNAFLVVKVRVSAFIATLGMGTLLSGGNLLLTNGSVLFEGIDEGLTVIARSRFLGLPLTFYYLIVIALILWLLLERTPFGRYLAATGLGRAPARLAGVPTNAYLAIAFIGAGALAGVAGVLQTGTVGSASPSTGPAFLLPAYAAAFLGATTIRRGRFNVWGTMVGVLVLAVGVSGLNLLGAPFWVAPVFNGLALLLAVSFAAILAGRGRRGSAGA